MLVARRRLARATAHVVARKLSSSIPPLPPAEYWREAFRRSPRDRPFLNDQRVADEVVQSFLTTKNGEEEGKVVIEAYPGAGALTRSMLQLPSSRLKKLIVLEENAILYEHLKILEDYDPRVTVIPESGFLWSTYTEIEAQGLFSDVKPTPMSSEEQPNMHFVAHLPNTVHGDQLINQFFRCMPDQSWLFKYGRVPLSLLMTDSIWERTSAKVKKTARCKLSVIAEAVSDCSESYTNLNYNEHFYPPISADEEVEEVVEEVRAKKKRKPGGRQVGSPFVGVNIVPKVNSYVKPGFLDKWDYLLRKLFVLKASPLVKAMPSIAPGGGSVIKILTSGSIPGGQDIDISKQVRNLTVDEWALIVQAFDAWPFAPEDLSVTDSFYRDIERKD